MKRLISLFKFLFFVICFLLFCSQWVELNNYISEWTVVWADSSQSDDWSSLQIGLNYDSFTNWNNLLLNIQISSCMASEYLKYLLFLTKESVEKIREKKDVKN